MTPEIRQRFADIINGTYTEIYQREPLSVIGLKIWWAALREVDIGVFAKAVSRWVQTPGRGQFPPKPADILEMIHGPAGDRALLAWTRTREACARVGQYQSVCFDDGRINATIEQMGGWPKLCATPEAELPFRAKDFERIYTALIGREIQPPAYLPGVTDTANNAAGHRRPTTPILIGDATAAQLVLETGRAGASTLTTTAAKAVESLQLTNETEANEP